MLKKVFIFFLCGFLFSCTSIERPNEYGAKSVIDRFSKVWKEENRAMLPSSYILVASQVSEKGAITDKLINFAKTVKYGDAAGVDQKQVDKLLRTIPMYEDIAYISFNSRTLIVAIKLLAEKNPEALKNKYFGFKTTYNTFPVTEEEVKILADKYGFFYIVEFN